MGLLSIAWADGNFDESERHLIEDVLSDEDNINLDQAFQPLSREVLQADIGTDPADAENFVKTAVMVALADGLYSSAEDDILRQYCEALNLEHTVLDPLRSTLDGQAAGPALAHAPDLLAPVRDWLDGVEVKDPKVARFLCRLIPADCPFERDVVLFGKKIVHIPAMCKINPLYEQLVGLRFRSLSYLADDCHEDVSPYL
ncbi:Mo-dependent nitrogenase C-terminal domain-containing protein [Lyngbya confervoides]|uniref:TerB family tellurite resistance protein n=1 Tax=Lyngbya confervoides BDU141951 TaxID=1574623 RepID=A0ABD4T190_9CYAN|nr:Mo-dependent nitrogenase C-terminal domain-containing protein [Lyngbya confervoides]MCM1982166.1 TerB family tellurite resistance protein [Lyngbya confervoides BDU141951]